MDKGKSYTKVPNTIYDSLLQQPLTASQLKTVMFVIRKTAGWGKSSDLISYGQIEKGTDLSRRAAIRAVGSLVGMGILKVKKRDGGKNEMSVNEPAKWSELVSCVTPVSSVTPKLVSPVTPTKEKKETRLSADADYALEEDGVGYYDDILKQFEDV